MNELTVIGGRKVKNFFNKQALEPWKKATIFLLFFLFCSSALVHPAVDRVGILIRELKTGDLPRRTRAAVELGRIKHPRVVKPLIDALKDKHWTVRRIAAEALGRMREPCALKPLILTLKDWVPDVRGAAAEALGRIRDRRAIRPLIDSLKDENSVVRKKAAMALATITGKNFGQDPFKWQTWWEKMVRK